MRDYANAREDVLDAAEVLVAHEGVKKLTIAGVAEAAQMSRGGVLYHFPSKEALIEAMVQRMVDRFQAALDLEMSYDPNPHGRLTRAYARLVLKGDAATGAAMSALIAGLSYNPQLLDPLHERVRQWQQQSETELDPTIAAIVRLTTHALWTNNLLLTNDLTVEARHAIVERLVMMTQE